MTRIVAETDGQEPEPQGALRHQGGRRDQDGREKQHREGVLQPAGQVEEGRELQDVEGQDEGGGIVAEAMAGGILEPQEQVEPGRGGDGEKQKPKGSSKPKPEPDPGHGDRLTGDRQPAQPHQGVEAQVPGVARPRGGVSCPFRSG